MPFSTPSRSIVADLVNWLPHDEANYIYGNARMGAPLRTWLVVRSVIYRAFAGSISNLKNLAYTDRVLSGAYGIEVEFDGPEGVFVTCTEAENSPCVLHEQGKKECYRLRYGGSSSCLKMVKDVTTGP